MHRTYYPQNNCMKAGLIKSILNSKFSNPIATNPYQLISQTSLITAPFNNMRNLKFKSLSGFFGTPNKRCPVYIPPMRSEMRVYSADCLQTTTSQQRDDSLGSVKPGGWGEVDLDNLFTFFKALKTLGLN